MLVLDSTVLIDHLRGRSAAARIQQLLDAGDVLATTAINVEEIARGLRTQREERAARTLFEGLVVLPIGRDVAWRAGEWRRAAAGKGVTLAQADCLIAAAADLNGSRLATGNARDFSSLPVSVELWPVGS